MFGTCIIAKFGHESVAFGSQRKWLLKKKNRIFVCILIMFIIEPYLNQNDPLIIIFIFNPNFIWT